MDKEEKQKRGQMEREKSMQRWRLREELDRLSEISKEREIRRQRNICHFLWGN